MVSSIAIATCKADPEQQTPTPTSPGRPTHEDRLTVRNVAEYAYCPRLFYLMAVEGQWQASSDTEEGVRVHRKVDRPSQVKEEDSRPRVVRSLTLSSNRLKLEGRLDLVEVENNRAVPLEYRKGRPRRDRFKLHEDEGISSPPTPEPWPADRIQIGLQALLLEEAGYEVPRAEIYYAEEKAKVALEVDEALRADALAVLHAARTTATGVRPDPLVQDARCPRCSLQPICLPDEVNYLRSESEELSPRRIWPPCCDGIQVVAQCQGTRIGLSAGTLRVTEADGTKGREIPLASVESVSLLGSVQITTQALVALAERKVPIAYLSPLGRMIAMVEPLDESSAQVRRAQVRRLDRELDRLTLARAVVSSKIHNQRILLQRNHADLPKTVVVELTARQTSAERASSIDELMGHEGQAAAIYFATLPDLLRPPFSTEFKKNGRERRPPPDPVNSCLSMGYSMLAKECVTAIRLAKLDPAQGALHTDRGGRPALALDLMEPFRPLVADSVMLTALNKGELTQGHFQRTAAGCLLTDLGRRAFFNAYGRRLQTDVTHSVFGYRLSYRRMLILHARMLAAWLLGDLSSLSFLTTR